MFAQLPYNQKVVINTNHPHFDQDALILNEIERAYLMGAADSDIRYQFIEFFVVEATGIAKRDDLTLYELTTRQRASSILSDDVGSLVSGVDLTLRNHPDAPTRRAQLAHAHHIFYLARIVNTCVRDDPYDQMVDEQISLEAAD